MALIIFLFFTLVLDVCATIINYIQGNFLWAVILGFCSGAVFINLIWSIKNKIEE
jgi:hypothetical protein